MIANQAGDVEGQRQVSDSGSGEATVGGALSEPRELLRTAWFPAESSVPLLYWQRAPSVPPPQISGYLVPTANSQGLCTSHRASSPGALLPGD